ncbi:hypothetical protein FJY94_05740 [Candidatus Kaiserbacteria bacterium]|nr:hypothetical protein [Candidatus Kaiserbacteria bacterium]
MGGQSVARVASLVTAFLLIITPAAAFAGSQTFSAPGNHSFTVPAYETLTVEVWGAGGGASGGASVDWGVPGLRNISVGAEGEASSFSSLKATGGAGGTNARHPVYGTYVPASGGAGGQGYGGSTNLTGGSGSGGTGGAGANGGAGGAADGSGGSWPGGGGGGAGDAGGGGGIGAGPVACCTGGSGAAGAARFTWTSSGQTLTVCAAGFRLDGGRCVTDACPICPAGKTLNESGVCVPETVCTVGFHLDTVTNQCVLGSVCVVGTHFDGATNACVPNTSCPAGQSWNGSMCICPIGTVWYHNQCQAGLCIPGLECGADGNVYHKNLQCELSLFEECEWGCANAACNPPPAPQIVTWKVSPSLVRKNATATVSWEVLNVIACTVTGTNGDRWDLIKGSEVSSPLIARTTYTLHCTPYKGAMWGDRTAVVNIIPVFQEQ